MSAHTIPFGRHKGQPLSAVPASYLSWLIATVKLSAGLRGAVADELRRRGVTPPPPPPPPLEPRCHRCGREPPHSYRWAEDRLGRRVIRRGCRRCGAWLGHAPRVEPFVSLADDQASMTSVLDTLTLADEEGVALKSDGAVCDFATMPDWRKASPRLRELLRHCRAELGRMLGVTHDD
jgi:hypothetical protein